MHPDYRSTAPGVCPRCGMKLVFGIPNRTELPLELIHEPAVLQPGKNATLRLRILQPSGSLERHFAIVHEKLMHVFLVSQDLEYFAHLHPTLQEDGSFELPVCPPVGGMYRLLADFYPIGSVPQLAAATFFVSGKVNRQHLSVALAPFKAANLKASLRLEPEQPIAGLETRLLFTLDPADGLERYLGAWAHMLIASGDLIDLIHIHPFLTDERQHMQFNVIFPRPGWHRVWTQFQRLGTVNTTQFTLLVAAL
ncbi:MAG: hypothetical protein JO340_14110 [Acidobacteriaceae bacterium]|nr:hypothetical protein [Acidobacteriaceae bacterium]